MSTETGPAVWADGRTATQLAADAAEAVRAVNHLILWPGGLTDMADVVSLLASLEQLAQRLPQAFRQISRTVEEWHGTALLSDDAGEDPVPIALAALDQDSTRAAHTLAFSLGEAHQALGWVNGPSGGGD